MRIIGAVVILILIGMFLWTVADLNYAVQAERAVEAGSTQTDLNFRTQVENRSQPLSGDGISHQARETFPIPPRIRADEDISLPVYESPAKKTEKNREKSQAANEFERLIIPTLKVNAKLVFKPYSELSWDLTDLDHSVARLGDIPEQETENNTVIAGHITLRNGSNGPFRYLSRLTTGDKLILYTQRSKFTYIVREQVLVYPEETSVIKDTPQPQLTLITCTTWDEKTSSYLRRHVVFADLDKIEEIVKLAD